jgi:hypothetical protein
LIPAPFPPQIRQGILPGYGIVLEGLDWWPETAYFQTDLSASQR